MSEDRTPPVVARWYGDWIRADAEARAAEIGRSGLSYQDFCGALRLEIGWAVREMHWGNGYATEIGFIGLALARRTVRLLRDLPRRLI